MHPDLWQRRVADWPEVDVCSVDLGDRWEVTRWEPGGPVVYLHRRLTQVQQRAALTHALEHLDRGAPCASLRATIEQRVVAATARWLLPDLTAIADSISAFDGDLRRVAHELWVPFHILLDRLRGLDAAEARVIDDWLTRVA